MTVQESWNDLQFEMEGITASCIPAITSTRAGEIPMCRREKLLCWTAPHPSLPFLLLPPLHPSSWGQDDWTGRWESLCRQVKEESHRSYHCKALTDSSLPILVVNRLLPSHPNCCCLVHKDELCLRWYFSITPPFP